ncbi:hypothetical protein GGTG_09203 [Gaeumannomyces tritici R3-111a-1]|uniref:Uncharacterized protein n=1 Tax=Gaeumannomyces tritici (strain R3-111a-1) TaxID=644352 RepID=J3P6R1_GAET3|nr:hypothetical protein GGTG_09203 [Gaeumannomyces tritici R3-111a-1]EJT72337.1 hypothetical protein GGTG_09203 [Gaeumannomyces tritici R3-111a-1]
MLGHLTAAALAAASLALPAAAAVPGQLQQILDGARENPLYRYPTSLTRDIIPKAVHSHNDYWRDVPFYTALSRGCISVEADVWLYGDDRLLVGHDRSSLSENRTFDSLYVQPILSVLRAQNPAHGFLPPGDAPTRNGVYDAGPGQTLYLFVDVKTDGAATWPAVVRALGPLREAGYLTTVRNGTAGTAAVPESGPVTVVGTGNTPRALVEGAPAPRDYFWDAPAADLARDGFKDVGAALSPIASAGFGDALGAGEGSAARRSGVLNDTQLALLREQVGAAHARGIKVRYWDTPGWPVAARNKVWRTLWEAGVDLLNADDLEDAAGFWEE